MRGIRLLAAIVTLAVLFPALPGQAAPGGSSGSYGVRPQGSAIPEMSGGVVKRESTEVRAAGDDVYALAEGRYIVTFTADVADPVTIADRLGRSIGFEPAMIYTSAIRGFAAHLSADQAAALSRRAVVASIEPDEVIPLPRALSVPTGVERIGTIANKTARLNGVDERINADVAVLDSGVDLDHPDLNIYRRYDCTSSTGEGWDDQGHGTHVAGTIGAFDNGSGVVGVAPGARIWSIKIFTASGALRSWILCGLQVMVDNGAQIDVANLSWGWYENGADGPCSETTVHQLICDAYSAGVTIVNAAGNDDIDASNSVPTTYSQVIAVSALADSDGKIGGKGPATSWGADDSFATFSNFGADIDIAAPGVAILSTCPTYLSCNAGNGQALQSGTSMSSPHVAGAAALYIAKNGRVGPAAVRAALRANSDPGAMAGDPDGISEPVLYVGSLAPACTVDPTSAAPGSTAGVSCTNFRAGENISLRWDTSTGTILGTNATTGRGNGNRTITIPNATRGTHKIIARGATSRRTVEVTFRIKAAVTMTPATGPAGTEIDLDLVGFGRTESITVTFDPGRTSQETLLSGATTSITGVASLLVEIPANATTGSHRVEVRGSGGSKVTKTFVVTAGSSTVDEAEESPTPTETATPSPEASPSPTATAEPTETPSPTEAPTEEPTAEPTETPTPEPTPEETPAPTEEPTSEPTPESTPEAG